jgi:hypothetical protein
VLAVFPHTALQSVVSSSGLARLHIGFMKGEKPLRREEGIRPALMVLQRASRASTLMPAPQDRPKSTMHKAVDGLKCRRPRVFEVAKPAAQTRKFTLSLLS